MKFIIILYILLIYMPASPANAILSDTTATEYGINPGTRNYRNLNRAFKKLYDKEWPLPGNIESLRKNDSSDAVLKIKEYLKSTGDLGRMNHRYFSDSIFDQKLENAVKRFQSRHGLEIDGIVGEKTLSEMNVPFSERLKQIKANLERLKGLPPDTGDRYLVVNIPAYELEYFDEGALKMKMNVVVGEIENYTPTMVDTMTYIVFNPDWTVPVSIAVKEIVPEVISDPEYLANHNYIVITRDVEPDTIPPSDMNWEELTEDNFPYWIVQLPGSTNSLGRIKFMFPNNYNIYLHDTPADQLFKYEKRAFSHGCIRLEKPMELAMMLLDGQMEPEEINEILQSGKTTPVTLKNKVLVRLAYRTAWIDEEGRLNFRDDIYGLDK